MRPGRALRAAFYDEVERYRSNVQAMVASCNEDEAADTCRAIMVLFDAVCTKYILVRTA
jgi:hypothetical protein